MFTRIRNLKRFGYGNWFYSGGTISQVKVSKCVVMVEWYVSLMGDLRRIVLDRSCGLWYLVCCDLPKCGDISFLEFRV